MEIVLRYSETKPYTITVTVMKVENDLLAVVEGGDCPHIGAVAIATPRASLKDPDSVSSTVSVFTVVGHKDDQIASPLAHLIASAVGRVTVVCAGVHVEDATEDAVSRILEQLSGMNREVVTLLQERLSKA
jgi:hypothetical protein